MAPLLLFVWYLSIAMKAVAATMLARRGLSHFYPFLTAMLAFSAAKSIALAFLRSDPSLYGAAWLILEPTLTLLLLAACTEALRRVTESYIRFFWYACAIAVVVGLLSLTAVWGATHTPATNYATSYFRAIVETQKYALVALSTAMLFGVLFIPRYSSVPVRPTAVRNATILIGYSAGMALGSVMVSSQVLYAAAGWVSIITGLAASTAWVVWMTPISNGMPDFRHVSDTEMAEAWARLRSNLGGKGWVSRWLWKLESRPQR